jgi:hypothetical protein
MASDGITNFLSLSRSLTNLGGESRRFRLPTMNPFPRLDQRIVRPVKGAETVSVPARRSSSGARVLVDAQVGSLPEMATDVIDVAAGYAVENVKRDRPSSRPWARVGLGFLFGRVLGSNHRAARP